MDVAPKLWVEAIIFITAYYPLFLILLIRDINNEDNNGSLKLDAGKVYIKELLPLLQNKRVETVVDHQVFDVDGELIALGR